MARTPAQRGSFGRWLTAARTARYERQVDALADMKRLAGLHISQAEFSQWESGSRVPRPDNPKVARLYEFFGSRPEDEEATAPEGTAAIIAAIEAAIDRQTQAIVQAIQARDNTLERLVRELGRYRERQNEVLDALRDPLEPMPGGDDAPAPHGAPAIRSGRL